MANCYAEATGVDRFRAKTVHRLGSQRAKVRASTRKTYAYAEVDRDGRVKISVHRDGRLLHTWSLDTVESTALDRHMESVDLLQA